jgi:ketosteroid isomerase-like protein
MDQYRAEAIVHACHEAWSTRNLTRMLSYYSHDVVYTCNAEPAGPNAVRYIGREALRGFLEPVLKVIECVSVVDAMHFDGLKARTTIACYMKHLSTGIVLSGQYRQVIRFKGGLIDQLEEFHDAAKLASFWKLVAHTESLERDSERT